MGENIGAVARIISNFGLRNLRIVSPRDGWPNAKAEQVAAHGLEIISDAQVYNSLREAVADLHYVVASTANHRNMDKPVQYLRDAVPQIATHIFSGNRVGLMFGRESSGLNNEELSIADLIATIPTSHHNPSLNLSHAVALVTYELSNISSDYNVIPISNKREEATKEEVSCLLKHLDEALSSSNFFQVASKKYTMMMNIRNMVIRMQPTKQDIRTLQGMIKALTIFYPRTN